MVSEIVLNFILWYVAGIISAMVLPIKHSHRMSAYEWKRVITIVPVAAIFGPLAILLMKPNIKK